MQKAASSLYRQHHLLRASRIIGALRDVHGYEKAAQRGGRVMWRLSVLRIRAWTIAQIPAGAEGLDRNNPCSHLYFIAGALRVDTGFVTPSFIRMRTGAEATSQHYAERRVR